MANSSNKSAVIIIPEIIERKIYYLRGKKIMFDRDLAVLYGVETKALNQAVKRNIDRFPDDFMFQLSQKEFKNWRSQFVTSKKDKKGLRYRPFVFTENGVAMLSGVLSSKRAILVNVEIMRTFTKLREMLAGHVELRRKIEDMESKYDHQFKIVFDAIKRLFDPPQRSTKPIGFNPAQSQSAPKQSHKNRLSRKGKKT